MPLSGFEGIFAEPIEAPEHARRLKMVLNSLPVGVVLAAAPEGRIVFGNTTIEKMLGHPTLYSKDADCYGEWISFHESGARVESHEYPLARVMRGERNPILECRYLRGDGAFLWIKITGGPLFDKDGALAGAVVCVTDIEASKREQEIARAMHLELHHRMNNAMAMVQSIANLSAKFCSALPDFRESFADRIGLLGRTQVLLSKNSWASVRMDELVASALPETLAPSRINASGCELSLRSEVAMALGLALHELRANAMKFGALSRAGGRVDLHWRRIEAAVANEHLIEWREIDGPEIMPPQKCGLGFQLLQKILPPQLGGSTSLRFEREGMSASIVVTP